MFNTRVQTGNVDHLRDIRLFAGCDDRQLADITRHSSEVQAAAGAVLCRQGALGREAFVVVDGTLAVEVDGVEVAWVGPGDLCGEMALLEDGRRTATVRAVTPARLVVLDVKEFHHIVEAIPTVGRRVMAELARRLRQADAAFGSARVLEEAAR